MQTSLSNSAFNDPQNIKEYYLEQGVAQVGDNFVTAPDIGRIVPEFDEQTIRELIHPPFRIVYLRNSDSIQIIRVWRSKRLLLLPEE